MCVADHCEIRRDNLHELVGLVRRSCLVNVLASEVLMSKDIVVEPRSTRDIIECPSLSIKVHTEWT